MKLRYYTLLCCATGCLLTACDDDATGSKDANLCGGIQCNSDQTCVDSQCVPKTPDCEGDKCDNPELLCGDKKCSENEDCVDSQCVPKTPDCEGDKCDNPEDLCGNKKCSENEICENDQCISQEPGCEGNECEEVDPDEFCGDKKCNENEICENDQCVPTEDKCKGIVCDEDKICSEGECIIPTDDCNPPCEEGLVCDEGECISPDPEEEIPVVVIPSEIKVDPTSGLFTYRKGTTASFTVVLNQQPNSKLTVPIKSLNESLGTVKPTNIVFNEENWDDPQVITITGTTKATVSNKNYEIQVGPATGDENFSALAPITVKVTHIDDQNDKSCASNERKDDDGKCIKIAVTNIKLNKSSYNVLHDQTKELKATVEPANASNKDLVWTFTNKTPNRKDEDVNKFLRITTSTDTQSASVTGKLSYVRDVLVTVTSKSDRSIKTTAILEVKPYYPLEGYDYIYGGNSPRRNNQYNKKTPQSDDLKCKYFSEYGAHVLNHDLYSDIVSPKMIHKDGYHLATRASVVAAARFLTLQFPFDIPYYMGADKRSHYSWSTTKKASKGCEARIFGLNLRPESYNNYNDNTKDENGKLKYTSCKNSDGEYVTKVRENGIPWGCKETLSNNSEITVGLECSGFVTWSLRNGRFNIGDWRSSFYKTSDYFKWYNRTYSGSKTARNYKNENYMHTNCLLKEGGNCIINGTNANNTFDNVIDKFKSLNASDIIDLGDITDDQKKRIKAGDILYHPKYCRNSKNECLGSDTFCTCKDTDKNCTGGIRKSGHVAMIIGLTRDAKGLPKEIYVGEASGTGNMVTKYKSWNDFVKKGTQKDGKDSSKWGRTMCYRSYVVLMDDVYDYYTRNKDLKDDKGNPLNGNDYKYTDLW